ncbi:hypothetical protein GCM10009810_20010 [Nostocoides vanveenii]|uniref:Uncharacterized protein n=1 Tax=Nostocoides vanveenii TaxID=330835 RepID=A0ABP4WUD1_9MICO
MEGRREIEFAMGIRIERGEVAVDLASAADPAQGVIDHRAIAPFPVCGRLEWRTPTLGAAAGRQPVRALPI